MSDATVKNEKTALRFVGTNAPLLVDIYRRHWRDLCGYVYSSFGAGPPEPEDVAQQAFVNFASLDDPQAVENPKAFLFRTARNIAISDRRRAQTRSKYAGDAIHEIIRQQGNDLTPERVLLEKEQLGALRAALLTMPRKRRRYFLLNRVHGLSHAEIARRFGVSAPAVRKHVVRAVADLDAALVAAGLSEYGNES